jgi:hypothetical protein
MKLDLGRIGYAFALLFIAWAVLGGIVAWLVGVPSPYRPVAGDQCGPHHHWVYVQHNVADTDLSCETD